MATLRKWLDSVNFDWETGQILIQHTRGDSYRDDSYELNEDGDETDTLWVPRFIGHDHWILDKEFSTGFGGPEAPCFIAEDTDNIYFPSQYDGSTSIEMVSKEISTYLNPNLRTPYPGG